MKFEKLFYVAISSIVIVAFILITFISSPSGSSGSDSYIKKIYFVDHISTAHQKVIDRFNKKYKGQIEVEAINLPFIKFSTNERKELLARYLRSKSGRIDIFSVDQIWVPRFAKWAIPMEKHINPSSRNNLLKYAMQSCYYKDTLVAIPLYIDIALMFYRKDLLKIPEYKLVEKKKRIDYGDDFASLQKN
jgi:multiple sugar transport system substrate-binding protein